MNADGCTERRSRNSTSPVEQLKPFRSDRCLGGRSKRCHHCSKLTTASSYLTSASSPHDTRPSSPSIHFRSLRLTLCHTSEMCRLTIIIIVIIIRFRFRFIRIVARNKSSHHIQKTIAILVQEKLKRHAFYIG